MAAKRLPPVRPGETLLEEFLKPLAVSQYRLAKGISVPPPDGINEIVHGRRGITADMAIRLARYFGTSERFWLNLQAAHDLAAVKDRLKGRLEKEVAVLARSARRAPHVFTSRPLGASNGGDTLTTDENGRPIHGQGSFLSGDG